ncbi:hypothetical protein [Sinomicrobium weinanense]|uniref:Mercuric transport protein MerT n=1 Tax=Sinomicrobium weinanense TaxID=2842200 RepID=A0A926Q3P9_9FLAO|nr:hypothetical protein [Sinomicrobium weinanense]MBC9796015.1 hypothetical protein [Sinomicrobium weinanense]MBU3123166.1 hypothetical protein [Sinomicrobium weinanense]
MKPSIIQNSMAAGASVLAVMATKLCCWAPAIAALFGSASYLAWLQPMKPYLMTVALVSIGHSHYKAYFAKNTRGCTGTCSTKKQPGFFQSKTWLWLLTVLVIGLLVFSYLSL